jgi:hypothetical protein
MRHRYLASLVVVIAVAAVVPLTEVTLVGQVANKSAPTRSTYTPPRGPDGHADISGTWSHNSATPLERPEIVKDRAYLTPEEVDAISKKASELFAGDGDAAFGDSVFTAALENLHGARKGFSSADTQTGNYNAFWVADREFDNRTSLVSDPPDGRVPPLTPQAKARLEADAERRRLHPYDGPEDLTVGQRCITGSVPMLGAGYNNYFQIAQSTTNVAIAMEMRHDTRMIPVDNRPHLSPKIRLWLGDPRGRWEGDTFVVDSTNFRDDSMIGGVPAPAALAGRLATATTHVIERFTRVAPDTLKYDVTFDDPATWTKPWTLTMFLKRSTDRIYEYACHEGNESMAGTLAGARAQEKAAGAKGPSSR